MNHKNQTFLETITKKDKLFRFDSELGSWVRVDTDPKENNESSLVIEKDQDGYWFAW